MDLNLMKQLEELMVMMVMVVVQQNVMYHHQLIEIIVQMDQWI
jgi:hypothetical protein